MVCYVSFDGGEYGAEVGLKGLRVMNLNLTLGIETLDFAITLPPPF